MMTKKEYMELTRKITEMYPFVHGTDIQVIEKESLFELLKEYMMGSEENKKVFVEYEKPEQIMLYMQDGRFKLNYNGESYFVAELVKGFEELKKDMNESICKMHKAIMEGVEPVLLCYVLKYLLLLLPPIAVLFYLFPLPSFLNF